MLMVCHHLDPAIAEDLAFAESRIRQRNHRRRRHPARPGRISIDDVSRQPGHGPRGRGHHPHLANRAQDEAAARLASARRRQPTRNDNFRAKRYIAKYTINPAIAHGIGHEVGSRRSGQVGRSGDLETGLLRRQTRLILKGGMIAAAADGRPQRLHPHAAAGALPARCSAPLAAALAKTSLTFVSQAALASRHAASAWPGQNAGGRAAASAASNKATMIHND